MSTLRRVTISFLVLAVFAGIYAANRYDNYAACVEWTKAYPDHIGKCSP